MKMSLWTFTVWTSVCVGYGVFFACLWNAWKAIRKAR
jgi:hypothetical protein